MERGDILAVLCKHMSMGFFGTTLKISKKKRKEKLNTCHKPFLLRIDELVLNSCHILKPPTPRKKIFGIKYVIFWCSFKYSEPLLS